MTDTILFAQGAQAVRVVPVDAFGAVRLVSATYSIVDLREPDEGSRRVVVASTAATASTVATTITAAAGPSTANARTLSFASAAGVRLGGVYLLRDGAREEAVTIARLNGLEAEITRPVMREYSSGAAFLGVELEGTFPADVAADEHRLERGGGPFQVTWVYTIGAQLYVVPRDLWLTRYGVAPWVLPDEVFRHFPGLAGSVGEQVDPNEAISAGTDEYVEHMQSTGAWERDPAHFRGGMSATLFVRKRALVHMLRGSRAQDLRDLADAFAAEALQHANNLTEGRPTTRSVLVEPVHDTAQAGGEKQARGGYFARG